MVEGSTGENLAVRDARIVTINTGSSSLKAAVYAIERGKPKLLDSFQAERIGVAAGKFPDFASAMAGMVEDLKLHDPVAALVAVGHRIVHGGGHHSAPEYVSEAMLSDLRDAFPIDPEHLPQAVAAIEAIAREFPNTPQVACFDTYFHDDMPSVSKMLPLPRWLETAGVRRFGFHSLSYESIMHQLAEIDPSAAEGRVVIAHLGAGASMAAVHAGQSVDTTMGFTPTGGLMMGTRPGDIDPGLLLYLMQVRGMNAEQVNRLLNQESGLLGVSGTSQDVRDLLAVEETDSRAHQALDLFCHIARKHLAGLAAVLNGVDTLIFTGGIGAHAAPVRLRICAGLEFMGISIDLDRNASHETIVSRAGAPVTVRVMQTDEALMIARHTARLIAI